MRRAIESGKPMTALECFVAAHALATEKERQYEAAVDKLAEAQHVAAKHRDHYRSLLGLAEEAARWVIAEGGIDEEVVDRRAELLEYERGIARIRAARLVREAAEDAARAGRKKAA